MISTAINLSHYHYCSGTHTNGMQHAYKFKHQTKTCTFGLLIVVYIYCCCHILVDYDNGKSLSRQAQQMFSASLDCRAKGDSVTPDILETELEGRKDRGANASKENNMADNSAAQNKIGLAEAASNVAPQVDKSTQSKEAGLELGQRKKDHDTPKINRLTPLLVKSSASPSSQHKQQQPQPKAEHLASLPYDVAEKEWREGLTKAVAAIALRPSGMYASVGTQIS